MISFSNSIPTAIDEAPAIAQEGNSPIVVSKRLATKNPRKIDVMLTSILRFSFVNKIKNYCNRP
jgi:hypothetical protein